MHFTSSHVKLLRFSAMHFYISQFIFTFRRTRIDTFRVSCTLFCCRGRRNNVIITIRTHARDTMNRSQVQQFNSLSLSFENFVFVFFFFEEANENFSNPLVAMSAINEQQTNTRTQT